VLELGRAQVNAVLRSVSGTGHLSLQLSKLATPKTVALDRSLSRSLVLGLLTYATLPDDGSYLGVAEVARALEMHTSTAHRYVSTLLAVGLIERDSSTRRYRRAPVAG
jgi:DNA-binding MarR family transcriptional regulator